MSKSAQRLTAWAIRVALKKADCDPGQLRAAYFGNTAWKFKHGTRFLRRKIAMLI